MIVIVVGMHRSGTSALSGLLHQNGIRMGEPQNFSPGPAKENEKGFFENYNFRIINDMILSRCGYNVISFNPDVPLCTKTDKKITTIIKTTIKNNQKKYKHWGFKDPRTCLTLSVWKNAFNELKLKPKYILIKRDFKSIARSMMARGNEGQCQQFVDLASSYYQMAELNHNFNFTIQFEDLIKNIDHECERISQYLEVPIVNNNFIEKRLSHQ